MHRQFQEQIPFFVANTLPEAQARLLREHLAGCQHCQRVLAEWQIIAGEVRHEAARWGRPPLPPLSATLQEHVRQRPIQLVPRHFVPTAALPRQRHLLPAIAVAAAMVALVFVSAVYVALRPLSATPTPMQGALGSSPTAPATQVAMASVAVTPSPTLSFPTLDPGAITVPGPTIPARATTAPPPTRIPITVTATAPPVTPPIKLGGTSPFLPLATPTVAPVATFNPTLCNVASATGSTVNVYRGANFASEVVGVLLPGDYLITYVWDGSSFYQVVRIGVGLAGWVPVEQVFLSGECAGLMLPTSTGSPLVTPTVVAECVVDPVTPTVPLRRGPGSGFSSFGDFVGPFRVIALSDNGWFQIVFNEDRDFTQYAWLDHESALIRGDCPQLPIVPSVDYPTETPLP